VEPKCRPNFSSKCGSTLSACAQLLHEEGQTMAEYALVLAVITLAALETIALLSEGFRNSLERVASILPG
jgi:Flp pilus assembly pilin Flp